MFDFHAFIFLKFDEVNCPTLLQFFENCSALLVLGYFVPPIALTNHNFMRYSEVSSMKLTPR